MIKTVVHDIAKRGKVNKAVKSVGAVAISKAKTLMRDFCLSVYRTGTFDIDDFVELANLLVVNGYADELSAIVNDIESCMANLFWRCEARSIIWTAKYNYANNIITTSGVNAKATAQQ